jgi:hypothetical protein
MSTIRRQTKLALVAVSCAALGAGAGAIATAGAASNNPSTTTKRAGTRIGAPHRLAARAVHGDLIVATKTGFASVTFDRGTVKSVSGHQLTLTEGTKKATYKTVILSIAPNARVRDNRHKATLADVTAGQRVTVVQGPSATLVVARTR